MKQLIRPVMLAELSLTGGLSFAAELLGRLSLTPPGPARATDKPASDKRPVPGKKAVATAGTPQQNVPEAQPESARERLRRTLPEGNGDAPDRR